MPATREQIKHAPVSNETWRQPRTQVCWFDPRKIRPLTDHILVELDPLPEPSAVIAAPQIYQREIGTRVGTVLAVGPGKWKEKPGRSWEITRERFYPTQLKPGDRVVIGHFSDWESWNCDADAPGPNIVLCQEADVRLVSTNDAASADSSALGPSIGGVL
jgi:co-chaperonin GroES (HSP10)